MIGNADGKLGANLGGSSCCGGSSSVGISTGSMYRQFNSRKGGFIGDFGMGLKHEQEKHLITLNGNLSDVNCHLWVIRGNHDDPKYFQRDPIVGYSNITFVPDYSVLNISGKKILCVGGAISIDKDKRTEGWDWFPDEGFNFEDVSQYKNIDIVVTHTAPMFVAPWAIGNFVEKHPEAIQERIDMADVYDTLAKNNNIERWLYGHFHNSYHQLNNGTTFQCLDIDEFYLLRT